MAELINLLGQPADMPQPVMEGFRIQGLRLENLTRDTVHLPAIGKQVWARAGEPELDWFVPNRIAAPMNPENSYVADRIAREVLRSQYGDRYIWHRVDNVIYSPQTKREGQLSLEGQVIYFAEEI